MDDHTPSTESNDRFLVEAILGPLRQCARYRPAFGQAPSEAGVSVEAFRALYGADPLYHWFGLDSDLMYAAHRASGGITSLYRQLGIGCERFFRSIVTTNLGLSEDEVIWSYDVETESGRRQSLTLDARIEVSHVTPAMAQDRVRAWLAAAGQELGVDIIARGVSGAVFEVRQGYKSADSKRQNADLRSGSRAYADGYLPVVLLFSKQMNRTVERRYRQAKLLVLVGNLEGTVVDSTYVFCREVVGFDAAAFFERNPPLLRREFISIVETLLSAG